MLPYGTSINSFLKQVSSTMMGSAILHAVLGASTRLEQAQRGTLQSTMGSEGEISYLGPSVPMD